MKLPPGQLKKVLTDEVIAVLEKYGIAYVRDNEGVDHAECRGCFYEKGHEPEFDFRTVTDEELEEEIQYWIDYYGGTVTKADILENIGEDYLKESAFAVKMYDFLIDVATFTYGE